MLRVTNSLRLSAETNLPIYCTCSSFCTCIQETYLARYSDWTTHWKFVPWIEKFPKLEVATFWTTDL